jgi:serine/threonine protein kinase/Tfp pilus assembly protein PilF
MTPELWNRLKPLFEAAVEKDPAERQAFLATLDAEGEVRIELQELVKAFEATGSTCESLAAGFQNLFPDALSGEKVGSRNRSELLAGLAALFATEGQGTGTLDGSPGRLRNLLPVREPAFREGDLLLGRFRIVRLLGHGGMGEVYEAEDSKLQKAHVALKTILPNRAADNDLRMRFEREVLLAREVNHPNLCPMYDIFESPQPLPGFLFLTMKLLPGCTLAERLRTSTLISVEEGVAILKKISLGLGAIHAAGIVHRDIKTNNVMLDGGGPSMRLWITDFGLARAYQNETTLSGKGLLAGTPGYLAPELLLGHSPSRATDLFALGVVMHEVFTGEKPTLAENGSFHIVSPRLASSRIPATCVKLITECLSHDPRRRCEAFGEALNVFDPSLDRSLYFRDSTPFWTRRGFVFVAAASIPIVAASAWWKWDDLQDALNPLPPKRFVALLNWPRNRNSQLTPMLNGALSAIKSALSRFESVDRDLFVISPEDLGTALAETSDLKDICDSLGANLVLAAVGLEGSTHFKVVLRLLDPKSERSLRERTIEIPSSKAASLPQRAIEAAASLLDLSRRLAAGPAIAGPGTQSAAAFAAFQSAETSMKEPNDTGLEPAIEKYKQAVDLDPHYAVAFAKTAMAYCRLAAIRHDSSALDLARRNSQTSLALNPDLVDSHVALASVLEQTGNKREALKEIGKALALDPSNSRTLVWQAQILTRMNRWADAERTFQRVLAERPNYWLAYNELGVTLNNQGRYPEALEKFRAACVAAPGNSLAFNNAGSIYLQLGDFAEAVDYLEKSLAIKPTAFAASNISSALRGQAKPSEALPFALRAVQIDSGDDSSWLELADCYFSLSGRQNSAKEAYAKALQVVERHLQTDSADGPAWMQLALYQVKLGNAQNAPALIKKAEMLGANDVDSQLSKARILELLGSRDDALATLKACFLKGATDFQVTSAPDMQSLRRDPRYRALLQSARGGKETPKKMSPNGENDEREQ